MDKIQIFNELHTTEDLLFLGNAWDLRSALALEKAGFKAIGTTSWGIANSIGLADGELIDFDQHLRIIQSISENVNIPVSADIEAGYSEDPNTIVYNVLRTADIGVAGINIEDSFKSHKGLKNITQHSKLLSEIRTALDNNGFKDFYINARIDTYLQIEHPLNDTLNRSMAYVESGASGIFVPGLKNEEEIQQISLHVDAPLNILSLPGITNCNKLKELGVNRFSFGNALSDLVISHLEKTAEQLIELKDTTILFED